MSGKLQLAFILALAVFLLINSVDAKDRRNQKRKGTVTTSRPKNNDKEEGSGKDQDNGGKDDGKGDKGGKCVDKGKNCKDLHSHCTDKTFESSLKKNCALTCGYCAPAKDQCKDLAGGQCAQMKQKGLCGSSAHPINMQRMFCAKTCDLCAK
jgi:hypothetical protein